jgi:hypothetical protein
MEYYKTETICMIRALGSRLNSKRDASIADMYKEWSEITASAGWLTPIEEVVRSFVAWATTAPCDGYEDA